MQRYLNVDEVEGGYVYTAENAGGDQRIGVSGSIANAIAVASLLELNEIPPSPPRMIGGLGVAVYKVQGGYLLAKDGVLGMEPLRLLSIIATDMQLAKAIEEELAKMKGAPSNFDEANRAPREFPKRVEG